MPSQQKGLSLWNWKKVLIQNADPPPTHPSPDPCPCRASPGPTGCWGDSLRARNSPLGFVYLLYESVDGVDGTWLSKANRALIPLVFSRPGTVPASIYMVLFQTRFLDTFPKTWEVLVSQLGH